MATPTAEVNIPGLLEQLRAIKPSDFKDDVSRKAFLEAAQDAAVTVETPGDSISRIAYLVRSHHQAYLLNDIYDHTYPPKSLQTPVARLGCDLKLFETLAKTDGSVFTTKELAETTKSDQVLLGM